METSYESMIERLQGERVMLVGGAGFIGHHLALGLRKIGVETMVVDNLMLNNLVDNVLSDRLPVQRQLYQNFLLDRFSLMREAGVELRNADARSLTDLGKCFFEFQPTKAVHLTAISSAVEAEKDPGLCFDLQLLTLRNLLELISENIGTVNQTLFLSSSTVYGDFEGESVDEETRPRPRGMYASAKYMGERLMRANRRSNTDIGSCIIRPSALYGERCISRRVSQVFIENALTGKPLLLEGGGDGRLDFTYIDDLIDGMVRAMAFKARESATFNLTFGNARTILELADAVKRVIPGAILEERPRAKIKPKRGTLVSVRAEEMLGFKPKWILEEGYTRYCEWYVEKWERAQRMVS